MPVSGLVVDSMFAGCRIEAVAGSGGMGVVYRATQLPLGRRVALKVVAPERATDRTFRVRFERESRIAASIDHPNVIPVYAAGEEQGRLYLVMRWVEGTDLQALIARSGALAPGRAAAIVAQVAAGLDAAHAAGLVHRDVKPANVLLAAGASGHVYLSDFGLTLELAADARLTTSGEWVGTADFMAPEQFEGATVDARTDVYALGCLLYAVLTGGAPFRRPTIAATMLAHLGDPPPRPSAAAGVPPAFDAIVARALAKRPEDRYPSAGALGRAVLDAADVERGEPRAGPERPGAAGNGSGGATDVMPATTNVLRPAPPGGAAPAAATAHINRSGRRRGAAILLAGGAVAVAAAVVALLGVGALGADERAGPVSEGDVRSAVSDFARAYTEEDGRALAGALTPDVARVTPAETQRGRAPVVRAYRRQFAANATGDYRVSALAVRGGAVGRASGRYVVTRTGRAPITGRVVFGVERAGGHPRVALIAATPDR